MKLVRLQAQKGRPSVDLSHGVGLVGFIGDGDPLWGAYVAALHDAFFGQPGAVGPAPQVGSGEGSASVGSREFEDLLDPILRAHLLSREEYAAVWFGAGPVQVWLGAAACLIQGPDLTREIKGLAELTGAPASAAPASVRDWVSSLMVEARMDVDRLNESQSGTDVLEARLLALRAEAAEVAGDVEAGMMGWVRERQDAETRLQLYRDREQELRRRLAEIDEAGEDAACRNCGRPLGPAAEGVKEALTEEWEGVVQDGRWWRRRRDQLEFKPDDLREVEARDLELGAGIEDVSEELERRKTLRQELEVARVRLEHLDELWPKLGLDIEAESPGHGSENGEPGSLSRLKETKAKVESATAERLRGRIHAKVVALTAGRLVGAFPALFEDWTEGGRRGGGEVSVLELAARITMAELAVDAGLALGSVILPTSLDRLNGEDLPRALADLARLTRRIPLVVVKATEQVAAAAPERFDLLYRVEGSGSGRRVRRQRSGLGAVWIHGAGA